MATSRRSLLTALEDVIGQLFPVLLLSRLVSMDLSYRSP